MEKIYFLVIENEQKGPYSREELKDLRIKKDSLVWKEGLEDWVQAEKLEELKQLFVFAPPPVPISKEHEVVIKTKNPLKFEDSLKKEKITQQEIKKEKRKIKIAKEIKRAAKYLISSLIIGIVTFLITFGVYNGFKFLPYYSKCRYHSTVEYNGYYYFPSKSEFSRFDYYEEGFDDYIKWSYIVDMDVDVFSILDSVMDSKSTYEHPYEKGYKYFDRYINRFEDYELRVTGYNSYRYEDLQGNSLEKPKYDYYKSHKSQSYEYHKFETDIRNGVIKNFIILLKLQ